MGADDLSVILIQETIIKATDPNTEPGYVFPLSNFDRLVSGIPVIIFYAYKNPSAEDFPSILNTIKISLSETLNHFFPFSGQIIHSPDGEPEILCNNKGVRLIEASANISLSQLDFYDQNKDMRNLLLTIDHPDQFLLCLQITSYNCGGFSISWTFDHLAADVFGFIKFLSAWCGITRMKKLSTVFNLDRLIFRPRSPPICSQYIDRIYSVCSMNTMIGTMPPFCATERRLYLVKGSTLEALKAASNKTRTVALSAYLWKLMAKTFKKFNYTRCSMGVAVDGRKRIDQHSETMLNFTGNVISMAYGEESIKNLNERSLEHAAGILSGAIDEVANREYFLGLIDWVEIHRPKKILPNVLLGDRVPGIVVSSCHNMPVMDIDFGFGLPSIGMFCSAIDQMCAGYVNFVSSGKGDGSWFVSMFIWPSLAEELELDPDRVFEPITSDHLRL